MYLIPNNNRFYNYVVSIPLRLRYCFTLLMLVIVLGGWFYGIYTPVQKSIEWYRTTIKQSHHQYRQIEQAQESCIKIKNAIAAAQQTLDNYKSTSSVLCSADNYLKYLLTMAMNVGLTIEQYTLTGITDKKWYKKQTINFQLQGTLTQLIHFFTQLKDAKKMIFYNHFSLEATTTTQYIMHVHIEFGQL